MIYKTRGKNIIIKLIEIKADAYNFVNETKFELVNLNTNINLNVKNEDRKIYL